MNHLESNPPKLYGYDPDVKWPWSPSRYVVPNAEYVAALEAITKKYQGDLDDDQKNALTQDIVTLNAKYADTSTVIAKGAPIIYLSPLSDKSAMRLQAAKTHYEQKLSLERTRYMDKRAKELVGIVDPAQKAEIEARIEQDFQEAWTNQAYKIYEPELISSIISEAIVGWDNVVVPFSGKWERDSRVLRMEDKHELFLALVDGNAFTLREIESFT